jgi:MoxR-like ATPase
MIAPLFLPLSLAENETPIHLTGQLGDLEAVHIFDADTIHAVNTALAARRPLLVRGEPGVGKSQLARATAKALHRAFYPFAVDIQTEARDLLWHFDAIGRLAKAQVAGALLMGTAGLGDKTLADKEADAQLGIAVSKFIHPGPIWWAFDWCKAAEQVKLVSGEEEPAPMGNCGLPENGWVILIDEIDKAETDVPNGLLEALGAGRFRPMGMKHEVVATKPYPLVVITTNEERALPDAFLRRCVVLDMKLPEEQTRLLALLKKRGAEHFRNGDKLLIDETVLESAAAMMWEDRSAVKERGLRPLPGQAEYMDLLRALHHQCPGDADAQTALLARIRPFVLRKHGDLA